MNDFEEFVTEAEKIFEYIFCRKKISERFYPELEQVLYDTLFKFYKKMGSINSWEAYFKKMLEREIMKKLKKLKEEEEKYKERSEKFLTKYYAN